MCLQHIRFHLWNTSKTYIILGSKDSFFHSEQPSGISHEELSGCKVWSVKKDGSAQWMEVRTVTYQLTRTEVSSMSVCENVQMSVGHPTRHNRTPHHTTHTKGQSYWLYGGFQLLAAEPVPCCPQVHTRCPWAALPRFPHPGWPPPAACGDSAGRNQTAKLHLWIKALPVVRLHNQWQIPVQQHVCLQRKKKDQKMMLHHYRLK